MHGFLGWAGFARSGNGLYDLAQHKGSLGKAESAVIDGQPQALQ
jgi:hypothetical protein